MTDEERKVKAEKYWNDMAPLMTNLAGRWADEQDHEDIEDYRQCIIRKSAELIPELRVTSMIRRPFGFHFMLGGCMYRIRMSMSGAYEYKRIS